MSASEGRKIFEAEGKNAIDGTFLVRMLPEWAGFEIDFVERGAVKTTSLALTTQGFSNGGPCFDTLPGFLQYYNSIYKRQYNRSFPRLSCFRWDLGLKETHSLLKAAEVNQFLLRLSTSNAGCLSMGYKGADDKPTQILITLGPGGTYTVGTTTFTDFESLLTAPAFVNLKPLPSTTRSLGAVLAPLTEYFDSGHTSSSYTQIRRGASVTGIGAPTTDPSLYLMTAQLSTDTEDSKYKLPPKNADLAASSSGGTSNSSSRNAFPTKTTSSTLNAFPTKQPGGSAAQPSNPAPATTAPSANAGTAFPARRPSASSSSSPGGSPSPTIKTEQHPYEDLPQQPPAFAGGSKSPRGTSPVPSSNYQRLPRPWKEDEDALLEAIYNMSENDLNHLKAIPSGSANATLLVQQLSILWLKHQIWKKENDNTRI